MKKQNFSLLPFTVFVPIVFCHLLLLAFMMSAKPGAVVCCGKFTVNVGDFDAGFAGVLVLLPARSFLVFCISFISSAVSVDVAVVDAAAAVPMFVGFPKSEAAFAC